MAPVTARCDHCRKPLRAGRGIGGPSGTQFDSPVCRKAHVSATQPVATKGGGPTMKSTSSVLAVVLLLAITYACSTTKPKGVETDPAVRAQRAPEKSFDDRVDDNAKEMLKEGKKISRYDTFGSEEFW